MLAHRFPSLYVCYGRNLQLLIAYNIGQWDHCYENIIIVTYSYNNIS